MSTPKRIEQWHVEAAIDAMKYGVAPFIEHILTPSECGAKIAEAIADHEPASSSSTDQELVEGVWGELERISVEKMATNCAMSGVILISKLDLAAAIEAAGGGK